ncbi:alpha-tocopherol transfer protein-like [Lucilia sericata]|uniref:alpha-tocopherol transfer protein-like n=1 Tax=Lucilia sericata TaxID=13632 RepID=UPI0018A86A60|nr:alpha-tocopherol transfer protein-like [Lucilia sericata]
MSSELVLKLELEEPSLKAQQKALQELRETPENIRKGLKEFKELLEGLTDLNIPKTDEKWLLTFLRACKFYPESARDLVRRYFNIRQKYSEITNLLTPLKVKQVFDANIVSLLPQRDQEGRRIIATHAAGDRWNPKLISLDVIYAASTLCTELIQLEPETQINGVVYIADMKGLGISQALQYTPSRALRTLNYIQNNIPLRVKAIHFVNAPKIFEPIFGGVKIFFNEKFAKRILIHSKGFDSLHRYISPEYLPECYGGTLKMDLLYGPETYKLLLPYQEYFENFDKYGFKKY